MGLHRLAPEPRQGSQPDYPWSGKRKAFSNFYHECPVITEENREKKIFLLWLTGYLRLQLERTLAVLGIDVPEYM